MNKMSQVAFVLILPSPGEALHVLFTDGAPTQDCTAVHNICSAA